MTVHSFTLPINAPVCVRVANPATGACPPRDRGKGDKRAHKLSRHGGARDGEKSGHTSQHDGEDDDEDDDDDDDGDGEGGGRGGGRGGGHGGHGGHGGQGGAAGGQHGGGQGGNAGGQAGGGDNEEDDDDCEHQQAARAEVSLDGRHFAAGKVAALASLSAPVRLPAGGHTVAVRIEGKPGTSLLLRVEAPGPVVDELSPTAGLPGTLMVTGRLRCR